MTRPRRIATEPPALGLLLEVLFDHVDTPRALCAGQAPNFDRDQLPGEEETEFGERLRWAAGVCRFCPELTRCPAPVRKAPRVGVPRTD